MFDVKAKAQQAAFRANSPTVSERGRTSTDATGQRYGHMLALGHEQENLMPLLRDDRAVEYCRARRIKWWRGVRWGDAKTLEDGTPAFGPTRNLASSQIACMNTLLPLAATPAALTRLLQAIDPEVEEVERISYKRRGESCHDSFLELEWIGEGRSLENTAGTRGSTTTSADALLIARVRSGRRRGFLMESKFTESYPNAPNKLNGHSGQKRRALYDKRYNDSESLTASKPPIEKVAYDPVWQLIRMTLLGDLMVERSRANGTEGAVDEMRVVVVCPRENDRYYERLTPKLLELLGSAPSPGRSALEQVAARIWKPGRLIFTTPSSLIAAADGEDVPAGWRDYLRERYAW
jgi:hypothetical protein